ncbi:hypothetical protein [Photobacterium kishitanii]|uniref:Uncharacterized protein n=1 Tax=Photobacterium kishitanii TaxID=318456 RepID=A0A2T3KL38_9GAMM|nr:hypothetical protein [Photobacterium kishitanii]PSV00435.1 hypothetical protein C9J27_04705 [Photobacterium kishitanii]
MFSREVMSALFDRNVKIEHVFFMKLITACDSCPESFWNVFDSNYETIPKMLGFGDADLSKYNSLEKPDDVLEFLHDMRATGVLIHFEVPIPVNIILDDKGEFSSCSSSWNFVSSHLAYGKTVEDAIGCALATQEKYFNDCIDEARSK